MTGVFRVFIVEDVPDKAPDVAGTAPIDSPIRPIPTDTARVNVKVDSEIGRALSTINWRGTKENRPITRTATVELAWTGRGARAGTRNQPFHLLGVPRPRRRGNPSHRFHEVT
jgi:hypothetical protein